MGYGAARALVAGAVGIAFSTPSSATVLATCGPSAGQAFYLNVNGSSGWEPDRISKGQLVFISDDKGNLNLLFKDATGGTTDAAADGAEITLTRIDAATLEFGIIVAYANTGVTEVYNVVSMGKGGRVLLWTTNKVHSGGVITKVGAYTSRCN